MTNLMLASRKMKGNVGIRYSTKDRAHRDKEHVLELDNFQIGALRPSRSPIILELDGNLTNPGCHKG